MGIRTAIISLMLILATGCNDDAEIEKRIAAYNSYYAGKSTLTRAHVKALANGLDDISEKEALDILIKATTENGVTYK